jgi:PAS domain S-box-containing protein
VRRPWGPRPARRRDTPLATSAEGCWRRRAHPSGKSFDHVEITFVAKDGHTFPVEGNATGRFRDGEFVATHTFFRDVSDRKQAEALQAAY